MHVRAAVAGAVLALAGAPAWALETSSNAAGADAANVRLLQGMQMQNKVVQAASAAALQSLKAKLDALLGCQATSKFWNGSACVGVPISIDIANPVITWLPGTTTMPDAPTAWSKISEATSSDNGTLGNLHSCEYGIYSRTCGCSPEASKPLVTINGSALSILPRTCTPYIQMGYAPCNTNSPQAYLPGTC